MVTLVNRLRHTALRISLRTVFAVGSIGLPIVLLLVAALVAQETGRGAATNQGLQRLTAANSQLRLVYSVLQDAESGQRGFLLTGQQRYLEPYKSAVAQVPDAVKRLGMVVAVYPPAALKRHGLCANSRAPNWPN